MYPPQALHAAPHPIHLPLVQAPRQRHQRRQQLHRAVAAHQVQPRQHLVHKGLGGKQLQLLCVYGRQHAWAGGPTGAGVGYLGWALGGMLAGAGRCCRPGAGWAGAGAGGRGAVVELVVLVLRVGVVLAHAFLAHGVHLGGQELPAGAGWQGITCKQWVDVGKTNNAASPGEDLSVLHSVSALGPIGGPAWFSKRLRGAQTRRIPAPRPPLPSTVPSQLGASVSPADLHEPHAVKLAVQVKHHHLAAAGRVGAHGVASVLLPLPLLALPLLPASLGMGRSALRWVLLLLRVVVLLLYPCSGVSVGRQQHVECRAEEHLGFAAGRGARHLEHHARTQDQVVINYADSSKYPLLGNAREELRTGLVDSEDSRDFGR